MNHNTSQKSGTDLNINSDDLGLIHQSFKYINIDNLLCDVNPVNNLNKLFNILLHNHHASGCDM